MPCEKQLFSQTVNNPHDVIGLPEGPNQIGSGAVQPPVTLSGGDDAAWPWGRRAQRAGAFRWGSLQVSGVAFQKQPLLRGGGSLAKHHAARGPPQTRLRWLRGPLPLQQQPVGSEVRVASEGELTDPREEGLDAVAAGGGGQGSRWPPPRAFTPG